MTDVNRRDEDMAEIARMKKRICEFSTKFRETETRCRKPFFPADPCDVKPEDLRQWPGWRTPQDAYHQCLIESSMEKPTSREGADGNESPGPVEECVSPSAEPPSSRVSPFAESSRTRPECECKCAGSPSHGGVVIFILGEKQKKEEEVNEGKTKDECEELTKAASCPSQDMGVGRRIVYDKKNGMIPGYAGHVPAIATCSFGGNWGDETRKVLKRTFSNPKLKLKNGNL